MKINRFRGQELNLETMEYSASERFDMFYGGGSKAPDVPAPQPLIAPSAPVEEAGVEIGDEGDKKKVSGKSTLKVPLAKAENVGLNTGM